MTTETHSAHERGHRQGLTRALKALTVACAAIALSACSVFASTEGDAPDNAPQGENQEGNESMDPRLEAVLGTWTSNEPGSPQLEFMSNGVVKGTDGCNGIHTRYSLEEDRIVLATFASTLMACPGVDDWLRGVREVAVEGDVLVVSNGSGEQIGSLQRS